MSRTGAEQMLVSRVFIVACAPTAVHIGDVSRNCVARFGREQAQLQPLQGLYSQESWAHGECQH